MVSLFRKACLKIGCSVERWERAIADAARELYLQPRDIPAILAGSCEIRFVEARWLAWRHLASERRSYSSIAKVSGFDATTVRHACQVRRFPKRGTGPRRIQTVITWLGDSLATPHQPGEPRVGQFARMA